MYEYQCEIIEVYHSNYVRCRIDLGFDIEIKRNLTLYNVPSHIGSKNKKLNELEITYFKHLVADKIVRLYLKNSNTATFYLSDGTILNDKLHEYHHLIKNYR